MDLGAYKPRPWPVHFSPGIATISGSAASPRHARPDIRQDYPIKVSGAGRAPLEHERPLRGVVPHGPERAGRATSVPFTAVLTGPQRTTMDNHEPASTCAVPHLRR
jgi:hypothetical protein